MLCKGVKSYTEVFSIFEYCPLDREKLKVVVDCKHFRLTKRS